MKKLADFFLLVVLLVILSTGGFLIGATITDDALAGKFSAWKLLRSSYKFEQIEEANSYKVLARATNSKVYSWESNCLFWESYCKKWVEVNEIPDNMHYGGETEMQKSPICETQLELPRGLQNNIVECARGWYAGPEYGNVTYYALLDNGEIWVWRHASSMIMDMVAPLLFRFGGIVLGFGAFIVFMQFRTKKKTAISPPASTV